MGTTWNRNVAQAGRHTWVAALLFAVLPLGSGTEGGPLHRQNTPKAEAPIRALYVTGGGFHDFAAQKAILPPAIARRVRVDWTTDDTAGTSTDALIERHRNTEWTRSFDVVVYNMSFSHVVDAAWIERITRAHHDSGVGAVILHGAVHSYRRSESKAWGELMGAFSMRHDRQRPLRIETLEKAHPVMRGFPEAWGTIEEELYEIERVWPGMTPLAQAFSVESNKHHPVIWTNTHGRARVFVTSLGHNNGMFENPNYLALVTRGLLWTVGLLERDGTPALGYATGR
jgi:type 1 glutamine amidotransferase